MKGPKGVLGVLVIAEVQVIAQEIDTISDQECKYICLDTSLLFASFTDWTWQ